MPTPNVTERRREKKREKRNGAEKEGLSKEVRKGKRSMKKGGEKRKEIQRIHTQSNFTICPEITGFDSVKFVASGDDTVWTCCMAGACRGDRVKRRKFERKQVED